MQSLLRSLRAEQIRELYVSTHALGSRLVNDDIMDLPVLGALALDVFLKVIVDFFKATHHVTQEEDAGQDY